MPIPCLLCGAPEDNHPYYHKFRKAQIDRPYIPPGVPSGFPSSVYPNVPKPSNSKFNIKK